MAGSGYRSPLVNNVGNEKKYNCASNEKNYGGHIWDFRDKDGLLGATACIVVNSFIPYYDETGHWQALAWWIHDNIPDYSDICFFPTFAAFNITWRESEPRKVIRSIHSQPCAKLTPQNKKPSSLNMMVLIINCLFSRKVAFFLAYS